MQPTDIYSLWQGEMQTKRPTDGKVGDITVYTPDQRITHACIAFEFSKKKKKKAFYFWKQIS